MSLTPKKIMTRRPQVFLLEEMAERVITVEQRIFSQLARHGTTPQAGSETIMASQLKVPPSLVILDRVEFFVAYTKNAFINRCSIDEYEVLADSISIGSTSRLKLNSTKRFLFHVL